MSIRSDQGALGVREVVQPRPSSRKRLDGCKHRRYWVCPTVQPRPTSSAHTPAHVGAHMYARTRAPVHLILVRHVRRLDSELISKAFFRPTSIGKVGQWRGGWA